MKHEIRIGDEITLRKGGAFKVLDINPNSSYYCCLLKDLGGETVRRCQYGRTHAEIVTRNVWDYEVTEFN